MVTIRNLIFTDYPQSPKSIGNKILLKEFYTKQQKLSSCIERKVSKKNASLKFAKVKNHLLFLKSELIKNGRLDCFYCGKEDLVIYGLNKKFDKRNGATVDHVVPQSKGGSDDYDNFKVCCSTCNRRKADKSFEDFRKEFVK